VAAQQIVPEHARKRRGDPVPTNENPVIRFTDVLVFRNQTYELGRNPRYWQKGLPKLDALRFPAFPGNDRANLALVFDEVDWAGNFIPAVDRVFVKRAPKSHAYWFPLTGSSIFLYANTTRAPFNDVRVRKALSMAIDRRCWWTWPSTATRARPTPPGVPTPTPPGAVPRRWRPATG
jgi:peptide/nickel transport system substrate-binding protein